MKTEPHSSDKGIASRRLASRRPRGILNARSRPAVWRVFALAAAGGWLLLSGPPPTAEAARKLTREEIEQIEVGPACVTSECHPTMGKKKFLHGPMNFGKCEPCHEPIGNRHLFRPRPKGRDLCLVCHELEAPKPVRHKPFTQDCLLCHVLHESDERYFVRGGTGRDGCQRQGCHEDYPVRHPFPHLPLAEGSCLVCHTPHQSAHAHLLTDSSRDLCLLCHADFPNRLRDALSLHEPALLNDCSACHTPHGGETKNLVPADERGFCGACHEEILNRAERVKYPHGAMVEGKTCGNCHEAHASTHRHLLAGKTAELCLACHNKPVDTGRRMLTNVAEQLENSRYLHGPLREGNCVGCHRAHGSDFPSILVKAFPSDLYTSFHDEAYTLCYDCHDHQVVEEEQTRATAFRNGERNLHYLHVVLKKKGRSCRACHHEHASNQPKHIRTELAYGDWIMPLEYAPSASGGTCLTPCHPVYRYDRVSPVENKGSREALLADVRPSSATLPAGERGPIPVLAPPAPGPPPGATGLAVGARAPAFTLRDPDSAQRRLDEGSSPTLLLFVIAADDRTARGLTAIDRTLALKPDLSKTVRRWIVFPRSARDASVDALTRLAGENWHVLLDSGRKTFADYGVVGGPTAFVLDAAGTVRLVHRGYDLEMASDVRRVLGRIAPAPASAEQRAEPLPRASLTLQLARRLAERGLWEKALEHYLEVRRQEGLSPEEQTELAEVYLKLLRLEDATRILEQLREHPAAAKRAAELLEQVEEIRTGPAEPPPPPAVTR